MHDLSVLLFGTPQIKRGNERIGIQRRKDLALLIYLVINPQGQSRDTLATLLWPDLNQAGARSNLRKSLSRLKMQLGEDCLLISQDQVGLNPKLTLHLDIAQFDVRIHQFRNHGHRRNPSEPYLCPECQKSLEEAARLYSADFLQGFILSDSTVFDEWQFFQSESLRKNLSEVLEHLTLHYTFLEEYHTAIEYGRRWLALDRLNEPPHRQLMLLYALNGQHAAAVRQLEECTRLLKEGLGVQPEAETLQLYEAIKSKKLQKRNEASTANPAKQESKVMEGEVFIEQNKTIHNLPAHPAPFIGREKELAEIGRMLREPSCRLVTLLGPGGNGKTRLAVQFAFTILDDPEISVKDGIWFVSLAPVPEGQSIVSALTDNLGISCHVKGADARQTLLGHLHGRHMLLLLDNFEHLLSEENVTLISDILSFAPQCRILITSRERLNIQSESLFRVEGLEIPATEASPYRPEADFPPTVFSALQLFEQCARRIRPSFQIDNENYSAIAQICWNVHGMPLAIELAASWLDVFSPQEIQTEIMRSLDFLESNRRDLPDRQRSVRAVFDSSWNLLDSRTRSIVKALSVFRTSFTREAAQAISCSSARSLLDLTNKSWLHRLSDGRYQIHELSRQFAYEKFSQETATFGQVRKQFCDYYAAYTSSLWDMVKGPDQRQAYAGVQVEFDNIHMAWSWLIADNRLEVAIHSMLPLLFHYCESRGKITELKEMVSAGLDAINGQDKLEIILRTAQGAFHYDGFPLRLATYGGIFPIDMDTSSRAWSLSEGMELQNLGFWGILLAYIHGRLIDLDEGVQSLEQMLPHFRKENQSWELANTYLHIAKLLNFGREISLEERNAMVQYLSEARELFTSLGDHINTGYTLSQWGELKYQEYDLQGAIQQWTAARTSLLAQGEWATANDILWQVCDTYLQLGSFQKAFDCCQEIAQVYFEHGLSQNAVTALSKESFEKVRYGDISDALRMRQQCIDITREVGPEYQFGWNYWEMGEIMRVLGRLDEASEWYERSHSIFDKYNDYAGTSFYYRGMGEIAMATCDYKAAYAAFSKSEPLAQRARHTWSLTYVVTGLARSALGMNELQSASGHLEQAIKLAVKSKDKGITLVVLLAVADYFACTGETVKAGELGALVESHFSSWQETRKRASLFLESLKASMTPEEFKQAQERGQSMEVWETAGRLATGL